MDKDRRAFRGNRSGSIRRPWGYIIARRRNGRILEIAFRTGRTETREGQDFDDGLNLLGGRTGDKRQWKLRRVWQFYLRFLIGRGLKNNEVESEVTIFVVTIPKDPDFKPEEVTDAETLTILGPFLFPESDGQGKEIPVQVVKAEILEENDRFQIEMKVYDFEAEEISIVLNEDRLLRVEGEKTEKKESWQVVDVLKLFLEEI